MKLLVTAFEPFGEDKLNSSQEVLKMLPESLPGAEIVKAVLPVVFRSSAAMLFEVLAKEKPDAVLCLGQAGGRDALTPERVAINLNDARIPDNEGAQPVDEMILPEGPDAYFSSLPIKAMRDAIRETGLPSEISNTAGTFVCNQLMYALLNYIAHSDLKIRGGFLHLPYLDRQTADHPDKPGFPCEKLVQGVEAAVTAIAAQQKN